VGVATAPTRLGLLAIAHGAANLWAGIQQTYSGTEV